MTYKKLRLVGLLLLLPALAPLFSQPCDCVTTGNCPVPITDNGTFQGTLDVTVNGPNNLGSCPLTSVCFSITHTWIGDVSVSLTSPGGLHYLVMADVNNGLGGCGSQSDNAQVCIIPGTGNPLTNNTEYICNSGPCQSGTCCLTGNWTMPCGGVTDPITFAQQAPNCNLTDFNVPGAPANGTWTLTVNDVCSQDLGTLNNFSLTFGCGTLTCTVCDADGGSLSSPPVKSCFGNPNLNLNLPPQYTGTTQPPNPAQYSYAYAITQNGIILAVNPTANMTAQPPGTYQICGLSYLTSDAAQLPSLIGMNQATAQQQLASTTAPFCGDFTTNCISVIITPPVPPTAVSATLCQGDCITVGGQQVCQSGSVTVPSWLGCDSVINVTITTILPSTGSQTLTVCQGACATYNGQQYCPPGPHIVTLQNWQGCDSVVTLTINQVTTTAVISPANPSPISCTNTTVALSAASSLPANGPFSWSGPNGFTSTQPSINVTTAGTYSLTVTNNSITPACTATSSVMVTGGLTGPDLQLNSAPPVICAGNSVKLDTLNIQDLNNTNPVITFHSATPATPANKLSSTTVTPAATTTYYILGTTGSCTDEISVTITVNPVPTSSFTVVSPVCKDAPSSITYTGNAGAGATYTWNFNGGNAIPGTGKGPHQVSWGTTGTKTVTLTVVENGCTSTQTSQTVMVQTPLATPVINCTATTSSIVFTWAAIPGASGYNVTVLTGQTGSMSGSTSYEVSGLSPNEQVTIAVVAVSTNSCSNTSAQITCTAQNCPPVSVVIDPVSDICLNSSTAPFQLTATASGGVGGGTYTWTGTGITNVATGMFDPAAANTGANTIIVVYKEDSCQYNANITFNIFPQPSADFTITSPVCTNGPSTITYTGTATSAAGYSWDFNGGIAAPGTGPGPHTVTWASAGTKTVALTVTENGCASVSFTKSVVVESPLPAPQISCSSTTSSIIFNWNSIPGASSYNVNVLSGPGGSQLPVTYLVTGLNPGDQVTIEVVAVGTGACGNSTAQSTCTANDCPGFTIDIDPVSDICVNAATTPFNLAASVGGSSGSGTLTWAGNGITSSTAGTFNPSLANTGSNTITATYTEDNCISTKDIVINVNPEPVASFTVQSPVCEGSAAAVQYTGTTGAGMIYTWDFGSGTATPGTGAGPHSASWATDGTHTISLTVESVSGCVSPPVSQSVVVNKASQTPTVSCSNNTSSVQFDWPAVTGAMSYSVAVLSGPTGTQQSQTSYKVTGLMPGECATIELTVSNGGSCPPVKVQQTCCALDCPNITLGITPVSPACKGTAVPMQMAVAVTGGDGSGTGIWSGNGITNTASGTFDAAFAGAGQHTITYTFNENGCTFDASTVVVINPAPTADFTASPNICISGKAAVTYTGTAPDNATFTWDFGSGTATPGFGKGPHQVGWSTTGSKTVSLNVEQDGCPSTPVTHIVKIDGQIAAPAVDCDATTSSAAFSWNNVQGASGYSVSVLAGPSGTQPTSTSYLIDGLNPGEMVTIEVAVNGSSACPLPVVQATCKAADCPGVTIGLTQVATVCLSASSQQLTLVSIVTGGDGTGSGSWDGNGITDAQNGIFDPAIAGAGTHTVTYTYAEANCSWSESINVEVAAPSSAQAGKDFLLTCKEDEMTVSLGGTSSTGANITYDWDADFGAFPADSTILHPKISQPGTYTLTVTNTATGCTASDEVVITASQEIPMPAIHIQPISCYGKNDGMISVTSVAGGLEPYFYSLNGGPFTANNSWPFLAPGVYELTVMDAGGCENMVTINLTQPQELNVELIVFTEGENIIHLGDSARLQALINIPADSVDLIVWQPGSMMDCDTCETVYVHPTQTTTFSVTVEKNGCMASDEVTLFVKRDHYVYIPNAFSPNGDGNNDVFTIYAGKQVARIKSFHVFNRWGEKVYKNGDFLPNDPHTGWDGTFRGNLLNAGVYAWFAEIEFIDGSSEVFEGGVTLMK